MYHFLPQLSLLLIITQLVGILDSDWPVATFTGLLFPENNLSKRLTHGNPDVANHFVNFLDNLNRNISIKNINVIILHCRGLFL